MCSINLVYRCIVHIIGWSTVLVCRTLRLSSSAGGAGPISLNFDLEITDEVVEGPVKPWKSIGSQHTPPST